MFCPKCGEELTEVARVLTCVSGDMRLSPKVARDLTECFVEKTRLPDDFAFGFRYGGTWFCPGCGVRTQETEGRILCPRCSRSLNDFVQVLAQPPPHHRDIQDPDLKELADLINAAAARKRATGQPGFTAEEETRYNALLDREEIIYSLRDHPELMELAFELEEERVCVATTQDDGSHMKAWAALDKAGIPAVIPCGLGVCGIHVSRQDQERALDIIEADARAHRYWVLLCREVNPELRSGSQ